jgi:iron complex outermembrane receptor protein
MRWIPALAGCSLGALAAPGMALGAPASSDYGGPAASVAEIIVTAQKREENLETVPIAISAYTSKRRDLVGIETVQDLAKFTPGMTYSTSLDRTFIRGVGRQTNNLATEPGVAVYFDGVYSGSILSASGDSLFLDRLEVLRGPQGTLYGKNAIGGAINAISRRPTDELYAEARTTIGNYGVYNLEAAVSGPITDAVRFRIAGYRSDQERGYFTNVANQTTEGGNGVVAYLEGQLDAKLGSNVDVWLKLGDYTFDRSPRSAAGVTPYDKSPFLPGTVAPNAAYGFTQPGFTELGSATENPGVTNPRDFSDNTPFRQHLTNSYQATAEIIWHTPWAADLKYIGGFGQYKARTSFDADGVSVTSFEFPTEPSPVCAPAPQCPPLDVFPTLVLDDTQYSSGFTNEVDLASTRDQALQWIVGLYQSRAWASDVTDISEPFQTQLATPFGPFGVEPNPSLSAFSAGQTMTTDSYAGFAQADWRIEPQLKLSGGLRYTYDDEFGVEDTRIVCFALPDCGAPASIFGAFTPAIDITQFSISFARDPGVVATPSLDPASGFFSRRLSASWSAVTGTAGAEWTPDSQSLVYAKYSRGYKAGGFNAGNGIVASPETRPEFLDAYEVGAKRDFGRTLQLNAAVFFYDYDGLQIPLTVQPPAGPSVSELVNLYAQSYGLELEGVWTPSDHLQLFLNYAYLNAKVRAHQACLVDDADPSALQPGVNTTGCPAGSQNVGGQTVPQSPPNKVVFGGSYTQRIASGTLTYSADYAWIDQTYDAVFNRPYYLAPAFDTLDMRLIWNDLKGRYTAILYAKNILNSLGYDNASAGLNGDGTIGRSFGLTAPATYGVELQYRFH